MATSDGFPTAIVASFICFYSVVFLLSTVGNSIVLYSCYRTLKRRPSSIKWFIANLAFADLTFTVLSLLDLTSFLWTWVGGEVSCKLQSFLIEACYTTSVLTLVLINFERRKAVVAPLRARASVSDGTFRKLVVVWILSLVAGSPLLYAYQIENDILGSLICSNTKFGDVGKQVYYSIHAACIFIAPLTYMIYAQSTIFLTLRSRVFPTENAFSRVHSKRHRKVAKPLAALTAAFIVCWAPFIIVRTLMYFHLTEGGYYWRASQLLIFLNTALDPILYGIYAEDLKGFLQRLFKCRRFQLSTRIQSFSINGSTKINKQYSSTMARMKKEGFDLEIIELSNEFKNTTNRNSAGCVIQQGVDNNEDPNGIMETQESNTVVIHHLKR